MPPEDRIHRYIPGHTADHKDIHAHRRRDKAHLHEKRREDAEPYGINPSFIMIENLDKSKLIACR